ncbi:MAG TPA: MbtH family protein [Streptosporangiaceae bacterium]|jgi:MbtH protein
MTTTDEHRTYHVVVNDEGQYSIWADGRDLPDGWHEEGVAGTKQECLDHITRSWVDLRSRV